MAVRIKSYLIQNTMKIVSADVASPYNKTKTSTNLTLQYTFYNSSLKGVSGYSLEVFMNGTLTGRALIVNVTNESASTYQVIPIYDKNNNYKTITFNSSSNGTSTINPSNSIVNPSVYVTLIATVSAGPSGFAYAFNQQMTELLLAIMAAGGAVGGLATAGLFAAIAGIGLVAIGLYDSWGGDNGVYLVNGHNRIFTGWLINSPYSAVPNSYSSYCSHSVIEYQGNIPCL